MNIITKFTVATEQAVDTLAMLTRELAIEKFSAIIDQRMLADYIATNFNEKVLVSELNSMSNQWLVVYVDDNPAGYARITSKGKKPVSLDNKRSVRIADFGVLKKYPEQAISSLLEKCLTVCKSYEGVWINEYLQNPLIEFFESKGFSKQPETFQLDELPLESVCLTA